MTVFIPRVLLALACALLPALAVATELHGRVVAVKDGDTITVLDAHKAQHTIRLAGIDAPEKGQAFGQRSKESLAELVAGKTVVIETNKKDRYGRAVGKVVLDGKDVSLVQLERGLAWFYRKYKSELSGQDQKSYIAAEEEARTGQKGLWRDPSPQAPWDWRHRGGKSPR